MIRSIEALTNELSFNSQPDFKSKSSESVTTLSTAKQRECGSSSWGSDIKAEYFFVQVTDGRNTSAAKTLSFTVEEDKDDILIGK